jgi:hypothetical protein
VLERPSQEGSGSPQGRLETPSDAETSLGTYRWKNLLYTTLLAYPQPISGALERAQFIFTRPRPLGDLGFPATAIPSL